MSDIIYTPPASAGGGTTINPTNNFIPKRSNATTFVDSVLENGSDYLYSNYGGYTGLGLDFANFTSYLGDWNNLINGTTLVVNDQTNEIYTKFNGLVNGFALNFVASSYLFGSIGTNTNLLIDSNNQYIQMLINSNGYFFADGTTLSTRTGAIYTLVTNTQGVYTQDAGNNNFGIRVDFPNRITSLGDWSGSFSAYYLNLDDINGVLELNGTNLQSNTAGGSSGEHLVLTLNGTQYKIALLNP